MTNARYGERANACFNELVATIMLPCGCPMSGSLLRTNESGTSRHYLIRHLPLLREDFQISVRLERKEAQRHRVSCKSLRAKGGWGSNKTKLMSRSKVVQAWRKRDQRIRSPYKSIEQNNVSNCLKSVSVWREKGSHAA